MDGLRVGEATAAERVLVEKVALFPRELDAAASLLEEERVLQKCCEQMGRYAAVLRAQWRHKSNTAMRSKHEKLKCRRA